MFLFFLKERTKLSFIKTRKFLGTGGREGRGPGPRKGRGLGEPMGH